MSVAFGVLASSGAVARADPTDACLAAHVDGQRQRLSGKLRVARARFVECSLEACPSAVRAECSQWTGEVERSLPTLVLAARGADGRETTAVRVRIDDEAPHDALPASAVAVDPGEHVLRFTDARGRVITERVLVREGEKNKRVSVSFALPVAPTVAPDGGLTTPPASDHRLPASFFVAGAVAAAGVAGFATLGILGKNEQSRLERDCNGSCTREQVAPMYRLYIAADVSLVLGAVAAGVASWIGIRHLTSAPPSARLRSPSLTSQGGPTWSASKLASPR